MTNKLPALLLHTIPVLLMLGGVVSANQIFIEPGPGLPSLESLGITPAELYAMTMEYSAELLASSKPVARFVDRCTTPSSHPHSQLAGWHNAVACGQYLDNLGTTPCVTSGGQGGVVMCKADGYPGEVSATVRGYSIGDPSIPRQSYCRDVASAVFWVVNHCPYHCYDNKCGIGGEAAAYGNGDLTAGILSE